MTNTILLTFEDTNGHAETYNSVDFAKIIKNETVIGCTRLHLNNENVLLKVPLLDGYAIPYVWKVTDEVGTEFYVYYEEVAHNETV